MSLRIAQPTTRVVTLAACLLLLGAGAIAYGAPPPAAESPRPPATIGAATVTTPPVITAPGATVAEDELLEHTLTPQAEIRLGQGKADTTLLMRRSAGRSLLYTIHSAWRGIVEYLFPPFGLFHRADVIARVYDPELLSDLERARELMATADVSPLTIAVARRRLEEQSRPVPTAPAQAPAAQPEPALPVTTAPAPAAVPPPPEIDFDFAANERQQAQLREEATLAAQVVSNAMATAREIEDALTVAREELKQRRELLDKGVMTAEAVAPAEKRVAEATAAWEAAQGELLEARQGYERLAERIARLEKEAAAAHHALQQTRAARARAAASRASATPAATSSGRRASESAAPAAPTVDLREAEAAEDVNRGGRFPMAREVTELAAPRWEEVTAPAAGMVSEVLAPEGTLVEAGDELLRVANLQLARLTAEVTAADLPEFRIGRAVTVTFADYPEAVFEGWVAAVAPGAGAGEARVELLVVCDSGPFADDPYLALRWMTLQAGVGADKVPSSALEPVREPAPSADLQLRLLDMFPTIGPRDHYAERVTKPEVPSRERYTGRLRLTALPRFAEDAAADPKRARSLAALETWRASYIEGMTTTILSDGTVLSYPARGEINTAVRAMLEGRVENIPNRCAATMRTALGWGLGDAHRWAERLPHMGYIEREDGLPRPGDILVWPFTYGSARSQHIGIAVRQGRKLMLLSNLNGRLGTSEILGGYIAFYRPDDAASATP